MRRLVRLHKLDLLFLQETKVHENVEIFVFGVWGSMRCGWEWVLFEGASGGLILIWNEDILKREDAFHSFRVLAIKFCSVTYNFM